GVNWSGDITTAFSGNDFDNVDLEFNLQNLSNALTVDTSATVGLFTDTSPDGGLPNDAFYVLGGQNADTITGTAHVDVIAGNGGTDAIKGRDGDDVELPRQCRHRVHGRGGPRHDPEPHHYGVRDRHRAERRSRQHDARRDGDHRRHDVQQRRGHSQGRHRRRQRPDSHRRVDYR